MSGILAGKPARTDAQWARDVQQQLDQLANPLTVRVGDWVLSQGSDGSLQASSPSVPVFSLSGLFDAGSETSGESSAGPDISLSQLPTDVQDIVGDFTDIQTMINTLTGNSNGTIGDFSVWLGDLDSEVSDFLDGDWTGLLGLLFGSGTTSVPATGTLTADVQWVVDLFNQLAYKNSSTGNPLTSITAAIQALLSDIPATSITSAAQSLQLVPDFNTVASMDPGNGWSYDDVNGLTGAGCAAYTCDGTAGVLYGNWIPVNEGDVMSPQAHAAWTGLTSTGSPISLNLRTDTGTVVVIQAISSPGATSTGFSGAVVGEAGTLSWVALSGDYTVPSGVAFVRSELTVGATATAGTVEFSNAPDFRSSSWLTAQLTGITADIGDIYQAFATGNVAELTSAWDNLMTLLGSTPSNMAGGPSSSSFWTTIANDLLIPTNTVQSLESWNTWLSNEWSTMLSWFGSPTPGTTSSSSFWTTVVNDFINDVDSLQVNASNIIGDIEQSAISGLTSIWNWLTGTTNPTSSTKVLSTAVASVLSGTSLGADVAAVNTTASGAATTAAGAASTASTANSNVTNTWSWLFGTTSPTSSSLVTSTKVAGILGLGTNLNADIAGLSSLLFNTSAPLATTQIQTSVMSGVQGIVDLGQSIQNTWDSTANAIASALGLSGVLSSNNPLSALVNAMSGHAQATAQAVTQSTANANAISFVGAAPISAGFEETVESNGTPTPTGYGQATAAITLSSTYAYIGGIIRCAKTSTKGFAQWVWQQNTSGGLTNFYAHFYKFDPTTGNFDWLESSANLASYATTSNAWEIYDFPTGVSVTAGDTIGVLFQLKGSGTLYIIPTNVPATLPNHPTAATPNVGFTVSSFTAGATIPAANITYGPVINSTYAPYVGLGVGTPPAQVENPVTYQYMTPGTTNVTPPAWANYVDRVLLGGGGGGGGGINGAGSAGSSSSCTVGSSTLTATGGAGALGGDSEVPYCYGQSPGNETYDGITYPGGSQVSWGQPGSAPGGGGGSGYYSGLVGYGGSAGNWNYDTQSLAGISTISVTVGAGGTENLGPGGGPSYGAGPGAPGGVWLRFRQ